MHQIQEFHLFKKNSNTKIVYYPGTAYPLTTNKKHSFFKKLRIIGDTILVSSLNKKYSKKIFIKRKLFTLVILSTKIGG